MLLQMQTLLSAEGYEILLDDEDYEALCGFRWSTYACSNTRYARRYTKDLMISMHREIIDASKGTRVDHIDGNGLNNQRANLRFATASQNCINRRPLRGKYKGVRFLHGKWHASISKDYKWYYLGCYPTVEEAALAYNAAAVKLYGDYAWLNPVPAPTIGYAGIADQRFGGLHISASSQGSYAQGCVAA